jgi:uncharacterized repeat protein (TIGR03803 family)
MIRNELQPRVSSAPMRLCAPGGASLLAVQLVWLLFATSSAQAQTLTVLHTFTGKKDGRSPYESLIRDSSGNLYGGTGSGGSFDRGTVYEVDAQGKETILHSFWGGDGGGSSGLIRDQMGTLYGTAFDGGTPEGGGCFFGCGVVFKLDKTGKETVLYSFSGGADGNDPSGQLVRDAAGNLYGVTESGGKQCDFFPSCGLVFKVDKNGKEKVLHTFAGFPDGSAPSAGLIRDKAANLYGVTGSGGVSTCGYGCGTVFKVDANGEETVLYRFTGGTDGGGPNGSLMSDTAGQLYGAASYGGDLSSCPKGGNYNGCGVVFKLDRARKETVLYAFKGSPDGEAPQGALVRDNSGNFYGITFAGGSGTCDGYGCGTVFRLDANGDETVLHSFSGGSDGAYPNGSLIMDSSGSLYGTTSQGGDPSCGNGYGCGVVFKLTP